MSSRQASRCSTSSLDLLLDTHAFLWWLADDSNLGSEARAHIEKPTNSVFVSAATAWEIAVKRASGMLVASGDIAQWITDEGFLELVIGVAHAVEAADLPHHHKDPFDRLLIAQARLEDLALVSGDKDVAKYNVTVLDTAR
jgi:PIN domain nuclease of toxin-antitoxin system